MHPIRAVMNDRFNRPVQPATARDTCGSQGSIPLFKTDSAKP